MRNCPRTAPASLERLKTLEKPRKHLNTFDDVVLEHAKLYLEFGSDHCPSKFHTTFHISDIARRLGRCLSCFVTERKHRLTKRAAVFVFRNIETTVLRDLVNRHCNAVINPSNSLFQKEFMHAPKTDVENDLLKSRMITSECGLLRYGDYVYLRVGQVAKVKAFWKSMNSPIVAEVEAYTPIDEHQYLWSTSDPVTKFVDIANIVDAIMWSQHELEVVRVILPVAASL